MTIADCPRCAADPAGVADCPLDWLCAGCRADVGDAEAAGRALAAQFGVAVVGGSIGYGRAPDGLLLPERAVALPELATRFTRIQCEYIFLKVTPATAFYVQLAATLRGWPRPDAAAARRPYARLLLDQYAWIGPPGGPRREPYAERRGRLTHRVDFALVGEPEAVHALTLATKRTLRDALDDVTRRATDTPGPKIGSRQAPDPRQERVRARYETGEAVAFIASEERIDPSTVYRWAGQGGWTRPSKPKRRRRS